MLNKPQKTPTPKQYRDFTSGYWKYRSSKVKNLVIMLQSPFERLNRLERVKYMKLLQGRPVFSNWSLFV